MTPQEKREQTIIEKWGSLEAYKEWRYRRPENAEKRRKAASAAGKASTSRPFRDRELAKRANLKSQEVRKRK